MTVVLFVLLALTTLWQAWRVGPRAAAGWAAILAMLAPKWLGYSIGGQPIDLRIAGGAAGLVVYLFHRQSTFKTKLIFLDFAMLALVLVHLASDWHIGGFSLGVLLRAYGEWAIAYLLGRVAIQCLADVQNLLPVVVAVACVLAIASVVESTTSINLFEWIVGSRPRDGMNREAMRWGFKRAFGPTMHPIYCGTLILLFLPWTMYAASRAWRQRGPVWWLAAPVINGLGVVGSVSRAPILAMVVGFYLAAALHFERWRKAMLAGGAAAALLVAVSFDSVVRLLDQTEGVKRYRPDMIVVDNEETEFTGTNSRIHLLKVYRPAMERTGLLGFGTVAVTGFPINVPVGPQDLKTLKRVRFIDNTFVLVLLRFGWLGLACFAAIGVAIVVGHVQLCLAPDGHGKVFHAASAGTIVGFLLLLVTVWMPHDFGFLYLFTAGATAGRLAHRERPATLRPSSRHHRHRHAA